MLKFIFVNKYADISKKDGDEDLGEFFAPFFASLSMDICVPCGKLLNFI